VDGLLSISSALKALVLQGEDEIHGDDGPEAYWALPWNKVGTAALAAPRWTTVWAWHAEENDGQPFMAAFVQDLAEGSWSWRWTNPAPHLGERPEPMVSHWATPIAPTPPEVDG
jgi:hypothetical protein